MLLKMSVKFETSKSYVNKQPLWAALLSEAAFKMNTFYWGSKDPGSFGM